MITLAPGRYQWGRAFHINWCGIITWLPRLFWSVEGVLGGGLQGSWDCFYKIVTSLLIVPMVLWYTALTVPLPIVEC